MSSLMTHPEREFKTISLEAFQAQESSNVRPGSLADLFHKISSPRKLEGYFVSENSGHRRQSIFA